jgi:hypothetical protein
MMHFGNFTRMISVVSAATVGTGGVRGCSLVLRVGREIYQFPAGQIHTVIFATTAI